MAVGWGGLGLWGRGSTGCLTVKDGFAIQPWWAGGATDLDTLVLLCSRHHALLEPARGDPRDQWQIRLGVGQLPEITAPVRVDPYQRPFRRQPAPAA